MTNGQDINEARVRIKEILNDPKLEPVQNEFSRIPIYGSSVITSCKLIDSNVGRRDNVLFCRPCSYTTTPRLKSLVRRGMMGGTTRTGLYKFGGVALGAMCGLQYGLWRMQSLYRGVDPDGKLRRELEDLYRQSRKGCQTDQTDQSGQIGKSEEMSKDPDATFNANATDSTKTNKYGDKLE